MKPSASFLYPSKSSRIGIASASIPQISGDSKIMNLAHFQVASRITCPVSSRSHREPYQVLILLREGRYLPLCNHPDCVLAPRKGTRKMYRLLHDKYITASYRREQSTRESVDIFHAGRDHDILWSLSELVENEEFEAKFTAPA